MSDLRMILNFEAVVVCAGHDEDDLPKYEIQLMVNHHVVYRWPISSGLEYMIETRGKGYLESAVAQHVFKILNQPKVTVTDVTP